MVFHVSRFTLRAMALSEAHSYATAGNRVLKLSKVQLPTSPHPHRLTPAFLWAEQRLGCTHPARTARALGACGVSV